MNSKEFNLPGINMKVLPSKKPLLTHVKSVENAIKRREKNSHHPDSLEII